MPKTILGTVTYSLIEAAALLDVTTRTVQTYLWDKKLKGQKIGGVWHITEEALQTFIKGEFTKNTAGKT